MVQGFNSDQLRSPPREGSLFAQPVASSFNVKMAAMTAEGVAALAAAMGAINDPNINSGNEDQLRIEMLGAGQEVGRSCCVLSYKGQ